MMIHSKFRLLSSPILISDALSWDTVSNNDFILLYSIVSQNQKYKIFTKFVFGYES